ncbi:MAG: hypothetical protein ACI9V1_001049 [Spirosomataceae bacterium]|jgi:hypothetical protein
MKLFERKQRISLGVIIVFCIYFIYVNNFSLVDYFHMAIGIFCGFLLVYLVHKFESNHKR